MVWREYFKHTKTDSLICYFGKFYQGSVCSPFLRISCKPTAMESVISHRLFHRFVNQKTVSQRATLPNSALLKKTLFLSSFLHRVDRLHSHTDITTASTLDVWTLLCRVLTFILFLCQMTVAGQPIKHCAIKNKPVDCSRHPRFRVKFHRSD